MLLDAFSLLHTTSPLPHTLFPLIPTYSRFASPNPFAALESPYDSDDEDPPSFVLLPLPPSLLTLASPTSCCVTPFYRPLLTSCTRRLSHPCPSPSPMAPFSLLNLAATFISPACRFPSPFGQLPTPSSHTPSLPSPPSFKPPARVSLPPPPYLCLPLETRHPSSLALNKLLRTCDDSTYHSHLPLNPPTYVWKKKIAISNVHLVRTV